MLCLPSCTQVLVTDIYVKLNHNHIKGFRVIIIINYINYVNYNYVINYVNYSL